MPNRMIKESFKYSDQVASLDWFEQAAYTRLIVTADDFGCCDGRAVVLKNELFPTYDSITRDDIERAVQSMIRAGLVIAYTVEGRRYLYIPTWEKHQRMRNKYRKFPAPPANAQPCADACQQSAVIRQQSAADCSEMSLEVKVEVEEEVEVEAEVNACAREDADQLLVYAGNWIQRITPVNMQELASYRDELPDDVIMHAIDVANAAGKPTYNYVKSVLNRYVDDGIRTMADVSASEARFDQARRKRAPAKFNYMQHDYGSSDLDESQFNRLEDIGL